MTKIPKLDATVPLRFGLVAVAASAVVAAALFAIDIDQGPVASAVAVKRAEPVVVRHDMAGTLALMHVAAGGDVAAGAIVATFDRRHIENELAALRKRIDARRMEIDGLKQEAAALSATGDKAAVRTRIAALDAEAIEADRVIIGHSARSALLEGQLDRLEIRAPVAGRIVEIVQGGAGTALAAKAPLAIIRPSQNRLQIDVVWPASAGAQPVVGQAARVWIAGTFGLGNAHAAKVESVGAETPVEGHEARHYGETRARVTLDVAGTELAEVRTNPTLNVQIVTGRKNLAEHLAAPLMGRRASEKMSIEGAAR